MIKTRKTPLIFLLIMIQSALAITAGIAVLFSASLKHVPAGVSVGNLSLGGLSYSQASDAIEHEYSERFGNDSIKLIVEGGLTVEIPFAQIEASVDGNAALESVRSIKGIKDIPKLFELYFSDAGMELHPAVIYNESKLRARLVELSEDIYTPPSDAEISYAEGIIKKRSDTSGTALNVSNAVDVINKQLLNDPWQPVILNGANNLVLQSVEAPVTMKDFEQIQQVLAEYTTNILEEELYDSIKLAVDSINGVILPANTEESQPRVFSFVEELNNKSADFENDNEGYDQVASTLYAALLSAGVPSKSITRLPHKLAADYIEPGLDSWISGNAGDLKFTNPYGNKIAIFAEVKGERLTVAIAGNLKDMAKKYEIRTQIDQRFPPPVYYVENSTLKPGERIVLSTGKEGIVVNVFVNGELIDTNQYEAEKAIIQIAPGTEWKNDSK